jgi:ribosome biogenesis GTPase
VTVVSCAKICLSDRAALRRAGSTRQPWRVEGGDVDDFERLGQLAAEGCVSSHASSIAPEPSERLVVGRELAARLSFAMGCVQPINFRMEAPQLISEITLQELGWDPYFEAHFEPYKDEEFVPARVAVQHRGAYGVLTQAGEVAADLSGRLRHEASGMADLPAPGDWVAVKPVANESKVIIHAVLTRRSKFSRHVAGFETEEQVLAANVDTLFLINALDSNPNLRRIERYLTLAWESGAVPVIVLSKTDLCDDVEAARSMVESIAVGVDIHLTSSVTGEGMDGLLSYLTGGRTVAVLGSSGAGKSTLINHLIGEERMATQEIRHDGKGRHTTSHRELILVPTGGLILDTPGMRELQLWDADDGIDQAFQDIASLASECRFRDCKHEGEPGCAVLGAIEDGSLPAERLTSYRKLQRELFALEIKQNKKLRAEERRKYRTWEKARRKPVWTK